MGRRGSHLLSTGAPTLQSLDGEKGVSPTFDRGTNSPEFRWGEGGLTYCTFDRGANSPEFRWGERVCFSCSCRGTERRDYIGRSKGFFTKKMADATLAKAENSRGGPVERYKIDIKEIAVQRYEYNIKNKCFIS